MTQTTDFNSINNKLISRISFYLRRILTYGDNFRVPLATIKLHLDNYQPISQLEYE